METRLKALLQEKGMMSKTLAVKMGISEASVSALVNGRSNNLETLSKAAQCLGIEMWELFASFEDVINSPANKYANPPSSETIPDGNSRIIPPINANKNDDLEARCPHCGASLRVTIQ